MLETACSVGLDKSTASLSVTACMCLKHCCGVCWHRLCNVQSACQGPRDTVGQLLGAVCAPAGPPVQCPSGPPQPACQLAVLPGLPRQPVEGMLSVYFIPQQCRHSTSADHGAALCPHANDCLLCCTGAVCTLLSAPFTSRISSTSCAGHVLSYGQQPVNPTTYSAQVGRHMLLRQPGMELLLVQALQLSPPQATPRQCLQSFDLLSGRSMPATQAVTRCPSFLSAQLN